MTDAMVERAFERALVWDFGAGPRVDRRQLRAALEAALKDVPEPSRLDNVEEFASDLVCKYHGLDRGYGKHQELTLKMVEALLFVTRVRDEKGEL